MGRGKVREICLIFQDLTVYLLTEGGGCPHLPPLILMATPGDISWEHPGVSY